MSRERVVILVLVVSVLALLYWVAWRSQVIRAPGEPENPRVVEERNRIENDIATARVLYEKLAMSSISEFESIKELDDAVGTLIEDDLQGLVRADHPAYRLDKFQSLREDVIGMLYHRWVAPSFDNYDQFLTSRGYVLPETYAEIIDGRKDSLSITYPIWTGKPFDPSRAPRESLRDLWNGPPPRPGLVLATRLRAVSIDSTGVEVAAGRFCLTSDRPPPIHGPLGEVGWYGGRTPTIPRYWQPRVGWPHARLLKGECIEHATIGLVLKFESGHTVPYLFVGWYDPDAQRWWVYSVEAANVNMDFGGVFF